MLLHLDQFGLVGLQVFFTLVAAYGLVAALLEARDLIALMLDFLKEIVDGRLFALIERGFRTCVGTGL